MSEKIFSTAIIQVYYKYRTVYTRQSPIAMLYAYVMKFFFKIKLEDVTQCQGHQIIIKNDSAVLLWITSSYLVKF